MIFMFKYPARQIICYTNVQCGFILVGHYINISELIHLFDFLNESTKIKKNNKISHFIRNDVRQFAREKGGISHFIRNDGVLYYEGWGFFEAALPPQKNPFFYYWRIVILSEAKNLFC